MYINDNVCYTNRIYGIQNNNWSINSYGGNITISDLKISQQ
jgi:beta-fructofuranosidase